MNKFKVGDIVKWGSDSERPKDGLYFGKILEIDINGYNIMWGDGKIGNGYTNDPDDPCLFLVYPCCYDDFLDRIKDRVEK